MMATTHALAGVAVAVVSLYVAPEQADVAVLAAFTGGLFPDADLYAGHRKTLHYPVYYSLAAIPAVALATVVPTTATVAVAFFLVAAALHSVMDAFGGGLELRPWLGVSERAVYDHFRGQWIRPRRWIRYDGAPEDLALAGLLALPGFALFGDTVVQPLHLGLSVQALLLGVLGVSAVYALLRKPMVAVAEWLVGRLPARLLAVVPDRFTADLVP